MARILQFPTTKEHLERLEIQAFNAKIDSEIEEIQIEVDREIYKRHGSMYNYGLYLMQKPFFDIRAIITTDTV